VRPLLAGMLVLLGAAHATADDLVLVFPAGDSTARLRVEVTGSAPPEVARAAFLDKLFDYFDRDGDGSLSPAEADRVFPLPIPGGRAAKLDFPTLDADKDGKATRAEFRTFYRAAGFTPVAGVMQPVPTEALALGDALFHHLDRDKDGVLSAEELRQAPALLRRLDENEDEVLTAAEVLNALTIAPQATPAGLSIGPAGKDIPSMTLGFPAGARATLTGKDARFQLSADGSVLTVPGGSCVVTLAQGDPGAGLRAAKGFYLAQFQAAAGNKPAAKSVFEDDPITQVLASLFDTADRNGDGKLTRAELEAFFDLIEAGVGCRVVVMASGRGRNLFDIMDADGDGRLDLPELIRAGRELPGKLAATKPLTREAVPTSYRLSVGRGPVGDTFGPVLLAATSKLKPAAKAPATEPRWFLSMDRNGDGYVSMAEFLGPAELFRKLDTDGDGRISAAEAVASGK